MKHHYFFPSFLVFVLSFASVFAESLSQNLESLCGTDYAPQKFDPSQRGGKYITATGTLRILIVLYGFKMITPQCRIGPLTVIPPICSRLLMPIHPKVLPITQI